MTQETGKPSSLTAAVFGENAARLVEKNAQIARDQADAKARRDKIGQTASSVFFVLFIMACVFGLVMGCVAMWNAVVG